MVARCYRSPSRMPLRGSLRSALSGHSLTARRRARLCSEEGLGELSGLVTDHAAVDDIGEVALEDPAGFLLGMSAGARVGEDRLGTRFAAQLGDGHPVQDRVDPA